MKKNNIYREAREKYNDAHNNPLNREEAAVKLHISGATLGRYETDESAPSPEVVYAMSKVYENPVLRRKHCSEGCLIGKTDHPYSAPKTLFESGYGLINANKALDSFKNELFEVLADGKVDKEEIIRLREIIPQIKKVQKLLSDIEIEIEKHSLKYDIDD
ncbi:helix-turn-helix transcriptional regulator [Vallitalea pronyensis]|uniref:Helix-turn-helix transcriptional regulator n=1 Tax=Vallitalea pronyensis TaxID=1348613 RepID=A0A8J8MGW2_9FIRM|nr:helix-turn-helix transcriptional regulator [Vallitalea pronyensis]QUI21321.1 helix-turn-helix transcriptional regulator [Vallitalea pronyensis]